MAKSDQEKLAAPQGVEETGAEAKVRQQRAEAQNASGIDTDALAEALKAETEARHQADETRAALQDARARSMTARIPRRGNTFEAKRKKNGTYVVPVSAKAESIDDLVEG